MPYVFAKFSEFFHVWKILKNVSNLWIYVPIVEFKLKHDGFLTKIEFEQHKTKIM